MVTPVMATIARAVGHIGYVVRLSGLSVRVFETLKSVQISCKFQVTLPVKLLFCKAGCRIVTPLSLLTECQLVPQGKERKVFTDAMKRFICIS